MSGLPNLIRLHRWKLEEQRRKMAELEALEAEFAERLRRLDEEVAAEGRFVAQSPDGGHVIGAYVQAVLARRSRLRDSLAEIERRVAEAREEIAATFRQLKRFELAHEHRRRRKQMETRRRERAAEDEVGLNIFRRQKRGDA